VPRSRLLAPQGVFDSARRRRATAVMVMPLCLATASSHAFCAFGKPLMLRVEVSVVRSGLVCNFSFIADEIVLHDRYQCPALSICPSKYKPTVPSFRHPLIFSGVGDLPTQSAAQAMRNPTQNSACQAHSF
jgi:hypothetical protein